MKHALTVWICLFLIALFAQDAIAKDLDNKTYTDKIKRHESRMRPFNIGDREFTIILNLMKFQGASEDFDETVESFLIVGKKGEVHYQKLFKVEFSDKGFTESIGISAYVLEGNGQKGFVYESGTLKENNSKRYEVVGLILYFSVVPSAPSSGVSCQVFTLKGEHLVPLFSPLTVYGKIYDLPQGSHPNSLRLLDRNTMKFGVWTGWFEVIIPLQVLDSLRVVPLHYDLTFNYNAFDVVVVRRQPEEETFVRFFNQPEVSSIPRHVIIKEDTKIEFLWAYARVSVGVGDTESAISVNEMPWLKVRIDGNEGFVRDAEDLLALGIHPAG